MINWTKKKEIKTLKVFIYMVYSNRIYNIYGVYNRTDK